LNPLGVSWSVNKDFGVDINPIPNLVHICAMVIKSIWVDVNEVGTRGKEYTFKLNGKAMVHFIGAHLTLFLLRTTKQLQTSSFLIFSLQGATLIDPSPQKKLLEHWTCPKYNY
jgi:hypothetical protein